MPYQVSYKRHDTPERGRHLIATRSIPKHELILVERPLCSLQSTGNAHTGALVCRCCRAYCGGPELCLLVASGSVARHHVSDYAKAHASPFLVPCRDACGEMYCSPECENDFWHAGGHSLLCTGHIKDEHHPLIAFKKHAIQHNEILLLVADVMVRIIHNPDALKQFTDFTMVPWWTVACAPLLQDQPMGFVDAVPLELSIRTICKDSSSLLRDALGLPADHPYVNVIWFANIIGSFEQNSMGIRNRHPLCRAIFDPNFRRTYRQEVIQCLSRAGMIGGECNDNNCDIYNDEQDNENCRNSDEVQPMEEEENDTIDDDDDNEDDGNDNDEDDGNDNDEDDGNDNDEDDENNHESWDYSDEEIATYLACLNMEESAQDGDDLDELFNPLDGTAMYATACKMNHSCHPNVVVLYRTRQWGEPLVAHVVALRYIEVGEELCISYINTWESLETRTESLANYGFKCHCIKCQTERRGEILMNTEEEGNEDSLFGCDDDDNSEVVCPMTEQNGESLLQRLGELNERLNKYQLGCTPTHFLGEASSFVIRLGGLSIEGLETKGDDDMALSMQACIHALTDRNLIGCQQLSSALVTELFGLLQEEGRWSHPAYRDAYFASSIAAAIGFCHVGSFLEAQRLVDKSMILGLPRQEVSGFTDFIEYFANQMNRGPIEPTLKGHVLDYASNELEELVTKQGLSAPIKYPVPETPLHIDIHSFNIDFVQKDECTVLRGFARNWNAIEKWRNLGHLAREHGHRMIPIELGTMMKDNGMKETISTFRSFIEHFLLPSCENDCWRLLDSQTQQSSSIAYLAQHPLLSQIPALGEDVEGNPCLCGIQGPTKVNVWCGTGGTRTPLHFDSFDNLLVQIVGAKYVRIYPSEETDKLYVIKSNAGVSSQGNMSEVNCELEDWSRHPEATSAKFQEVLLFPGDCLFIPARSWHYVRSLSTSISINYWW